MRPERPSPPAVGAESTSGPARPLGQAMSLAGDPQALAAYYGEWAATYDADVGDTEYGLPGSVVLTLQAAAQHVPRLADPDLGILDAGCGTGRIAMALADHGYTTIDGVDLSPEMVARARERKLYRSLEAGIDLTQEPPLRWRHSAELVIVGGVFTVGHIPPEALHQVAKLVTPGGVLITSVRPGYFDTTDYGEISDAFVSSDAAELLAYNESLPYTADTDGRFYAYLVH